MTYYGLNMCQQRLWRRRFKHPRIASGVMWSLTVTTCGSLREMASPLKNSAANEMAAVRGYRWLICDIMLIGQGSRLPLPVSCCLWMRTMNGWGLRSRNGWPMVNPGIEGEARAKILVTETKCSSCSSNIYMWSGWIVRSTDTLEWRMNACEASLWNFTDWSW